MEMLCVVTVNDKHYSLTCDMLRINVSDLSYLWFI
jgi:hypothetical protein